MWRPRCAKALVLIRVKQCSIGGVRHVCGGLAPLSAIENLLYFASMSALLYLLFMALGVAILVKASDLFTDAAVEVARTFRIPEIVVGATLVSLATTLPEFAVSFTAAVKGKAALLSGDEAAWLGRVGMAVGNAVGSTICNVGLILGLCALLSPMVVEQRSFRRNGGSLLVIALVFGAMSILFPHGSLWVGVVMLTGLFAYFTSAIHHALNAVPLEKMLAPKGTAPLKLALLFAAGAIGVIAGSQLVVVFAEKLARLMGVPELIIALTLVALGTSMPELVVSLAAIVKKQRGLSMGNIIGANILNLAWVIGACSLVTPLPLTNQTRFFDIPVTLALSALLLIFGISGKRLARREGAVLLAIYIGYLAMQFAVFGRTDS